MHGGRREQEAQRQGARIAHEDFRRLPVVAQEAQARTRHRRHQEHGPRVALQDRIAEEAGGDDGHHAAGQTVETVDEVDGIGHSDDPDDRQDSTEPAEPHLAEHRQPEHLERPAYPHQQPGRGELDEELLGGRNADQVVDHTNQEDQAGAHGQGHHLAAVHSLPLAPARQGGQRHAQAEAGHDGDAPQARHRTRLMFTVAVWVVEGAQGERETRHGRHHDVGEQSGDHRRT